MGRKNGLVQELKPCECGCGTLIKRYVEVQRVLVSGEVVTRILSRERHYVYGHRTPEMNRKPKGEASACWRGGKSKNRDVLKASSEYRAWAFGVYHRDRFICQFCGVKCKHPEAHHIKPVRDYDELILEPTNGITLCGPCHELTYGKEEEFFEICAALVANAVNSGEAPPGNAEGNPEPSREGNLSEGATTRGRSCPIDLSSFQKAKIPCAQCGTVLTRHRYRVKTQKNHFCNPACKGEWQKTGFKGRGSTSQLIACGWCGVEILRPPHRIKNYRAQYCTNRCMGKAWADRRWNGSNAPTSAARESDDIVCAAE